MPDLPEILLPESPDTCQAPGCQTWFLEEKAPSKSHPFPSHRSSVLELKPQVQALSSHLLQNSCSLAILCLRYPPSHGSGVKVLGTSLPLLGQVGDFSTGSVGKTPCSQCKCVLC